MVNSIEQLLQTGKWDRRGDLATAGMEVADKGEAGAFTKGHRSATSRRLRESLLAQRVADLHNRFRVFWNDSGSVDGIRKPAVQRGGSLEMPRLGNMHDEASPPSRDRP